MAEQIPEHDCGHVCCDDPHYPLHDHFLSADQCPGCERMRREEARHIPRRGDEVEAWLERWTQNPVMPRSFLLLLDDYRLHADTGTPLSEEVRNG